MYRWFNDYHNNNRFTCPKMPPEIKQEYLTKCKEYTLFRTDVYRRVKAEYDTAFNNEIEMMKTAFYLPTNLMAEVMDLEQQYDVEHKFNEESEFNDFIEYRNNFLYGQQMLRINPDDYHQILRTMINFSALQKKQLLSGEKDEEEGGIKKGGAETMEG
jgi:hypothetical protein